MRGVTRAAVGESHESPCQHGSEHRSSLPKGIDHVLHQRYLHIGIGLLVLSAVIRSASGFIISHLAEAVSTGIAAEQRALGTIASILDFVVNVTTPAGAAFIAGAVLIESQRKTMRHELNSPQQPSSTPPSSTDGS